METALSGSVAQVQEVRTVRRWGGILVAAVGFLDLISAVTPPTAQRFALILEIIPLQVAEAATGVVVGIGLALLLLARAVARGRRRAHHIVVVILAVSAVLHLTKAFDVEEAVVTVAAALFLIWKRHAFGVPGRPVGTLVPTLFAVAGGIVAFAVSIGVVVSLSPSITASRAVEALLERLVFVKTIALPVRVDRPLTAAMHGLGIGLVLVMVRAVLLPAVLAIGSRHQADRATRIVHEFGGDTLAYFALRDDKEWFISGEHLIAYGVFGDVCLVSPDPIGPDAGAEAALAEFADFVSRHGWTPAVLGAAAGWLPRYSELGWKAMYLGDEAMVDCESFTLEGRRIKTVREAVNRLKRNGYRVEFFDPAHLDLSLQSRLEAMATGSRQGDAERGFSMTLGRLFDPRDSGLLLAVAFSSSGEPAGYCQFVPAPAVVGYSLDVMRREVGDHPNGLMDFVVAETAIYLRDSGFKGLGLNFAVMKAVLKGEIDQSRFVDAERWLVERFAEGTQIESLYRFNDKFNPLWNPRYLVYRSAADLGVVGLAVATAESLWEIPIVGRFLKRGRSAQSEDLGTVVHQQ